MADVLLTSDEVAQRADEAERVRVTDDARLRWVAGFSLAWLVLYAVAIALTAGDATAQKVLDDAVYLIPVGLAAAASCIAARRTSSGQRRFWRVLALSNVLWLAGEITWSGYVVLDGQTPFPSAADVLYLSSYALVVPAVLIAFAGGRLRALRSLLDASIAAVAIGATGYLLTIAPQLSSGFSLATATGIAYPLLGVMILALIVAFGFGGHRMVPINLAVVALGFGVSAVTDAAYTYAAVLHSFIPSQWLDLGWQAEALLLMLAALVAIWHGEGAARVRRFDRDVGLPMVLTGLLLTVGLVVVDGRDGRFSLAAVVAGAYCIVAVITRLYLTGRDRTRLARELEASLVKQERLALSDGLTGLHNRRFFDELVTLECQRSLRQRTDLSLIVIDLDRFKQVNDRYGHPAGDSVLEEVARRLRASVRSSDVVARYGGEEFAVILANTGAVSARTFAERIRQAIGGTRIGAEGREIAVTASIGVATMPDRAQRKEELLQRADRALYRAKRLGRNQVHLDGRADDAAVLGRDIGSPVVDYLQNLADEIDGRQAQSVHSAAMAAWAGRIAAALGADQEQRERAVLAARFHDIGKVVVPDSILLKLGSLTQEEWQVVHEHPEQGARLVKLAPELEDIAPVIAAHHERPEGDGYPNGLTAKQIPLEASIVAVCDAWSAMLADRPYRRALSESDALAELRRCKGSQFDPAVVDTFIRLAQLGELDHRPVLASVGRN
jgi:two-component system, cell cycle response regulator